MKVVQLLAYIAISIGYLVAGFHPSTEIFMQIKAYQYHGLLLLTFLAICTSVLYTKTIRNESFIESSEETPFNLEGLRYCELCQIYAPIRTSHCKTCNKCVLRRDHHCPFIGTCVGEKNHLYFLLMMIFVVFFCLVVMKSLKRGMIDDISFIEWLYMSMPCTLVWCIALLMLVQPVVLIPMHLYLALMNRTTRELLKGSSIDYLANWHRLYSPFSKGPIRNLIEFATMHRNSVMYTVPSTESEMEQWRKDNVFWSNDCYQC